MDTPDHFVQMDSQQWTQDLKTKIAREHDKPKDGNDESDQGRAD
jgi:hypothetical protein